MDQVRTELDLNSPSTDSIKDCRSVWGFLCLSLIMSWAIWLWPVDAKRFIYVNLLGLQVNWPLLNLKLIAGNCLPGVLALIWARSEGKLQFWDILSTLLRWKTAPKWYFLAIAIPFGIFTATLCVALVTLPARAAIPPMSVLTLSLISAFGGPLWEEIAWRAFALRKLQIRYSSLTSSLMIGAFWAVWHIPIWIQTLNYLTVPLLLLISVNLIAWSVIFAFVYGGSGQSLPVVILLHAAYLIIQNELIAALAYGQLSLPIEVAEQIAYGPQTVLLVAMVLSACLAVILGKRLAPHKARFSYDGGPHL